MAMFQDESLTERLSIEDGLQLLPEYGQEELTKKAAEFEKPIRKAIQIKTTEILLD